MFRVSQKGARKWLEGEALPRLSRIPQIAGKCGVNGEWLLTGQGPMRPPAYGIGSGINEPSPVYRASSLVRRICTRISEAEAAGRLSEADIVAIENLVLRLLER